MADELPCPLKPRAVVQLASRRAVNPEARRWLFEDERGFWEREASGYILRTREKREREKIPDGIAAEEIAGRLLLSALTALLAKAKAEAAGTDGPRRKRRRR